MIHAAMFAAVGDAYDLTNAERRLLLGPVDERVVRLAYLLAIHKHLRTKFPRQYDRMVWLRLADDDFSGHTPLGLMIHGGLSGLAVLHLYLSAETMTGDVLYD